MEALRQAVWQICTPAPSSSTRLLSFAAKNLGGAATQKRASQTSLNVKPPPRQLVHQGAEPDEDINRRNLHHDEPQFCAAVPPARAAVLQRLGRG